jgi:hypothetical protein
MMLLGETIWVCILRFTRREQWRWLLFHPVLAAVVKLRWLTLALSILIIRFRATHLNTGPFMKAWSAWDNPSYCWVGLLARPSG